MALFADSFDYEKFLRRYWQQRPLLIRSSGKFVDPIDPQHLAGLACEAQVESRLVRRRGKSTWSLQHGPLTASDFTRLGRQDWTLLVQAVDLWWPPLQAILQDFRFLPSWRIDDVMVSFATRGGGVGPHFDYYDVFLIQGQGSRRWQLGARCDDQTPLRQNTDLKLLQEFAAQQEYILTPGDMLYVPPGISHHGVSLDDSLCYSVGFRAPSTQEMLQGFSDRVADQFSPDQRFVDTIKTPVPHSGELTPEMLQTSYGAMLKALGNKQQFMDWLGSYSTMPKYPELLSPRGKALSETGFQQALDRGQDLTRNPLSRFAFAKAGKSLMLYVDGECFPCSMRSAALVKQLCNPACTSLVLSAAQRRNKSLLELLLTLVNQGSLKLKHGR